MKSKSIIAELYWFNELSDQAKSRVIEDAKKHWEKYKIYSIEGYKDGMFYSDGRRYMH